MTKKELNLQVKDLYEVLNFYIKNVENSEKHIEFIIKMAKLSKIIKMQLEDREAVREIKKRKLTNDFIKIFDSSEVEEALEIDIKEARRKLKNNDFTVKERNIIMNTFRGCAPGFIKSIDTKNPIKTYGEVYNN